MKTYREEKGEKKETEIKKEVKIRSM